MALTTRDPTTEQAFLQFVNHFLSQRCLLAENLITDLEDGFFILQLIEIIQQKSPGVYQSRVQPTQPINNIVWIEENHTVIRHWIQAMKSKESERNGSAQDMIEDALWILLEITAGNRVSKSDDSVNLAIADQICLSTIGIPVSLAQGSVVSSAPGRGLTSLIFSIILQQKFHARVLVDPETASKSSLDQRRSLKKWIPPPRNYKIKPLPKHVWDQGVLRVFLSSTFRDMQMERDRFFQHGSAELKEVAKTKGLEIVFIDLRWGVTEEESSNGWVIIRCFESIQRCPYFVCFLGSRYGWIPDRQVANEWHPETCTRYPVIEDIVGKSVTEYEIYFAALAEHAACSRAFFFFRDEDYAVRNAPNETVKTLMLPTSEKDRALQDALKEDIMKKFGALVYKGRAEFSDYVVSHLKHAIEDDFRVASLLEPEDQAHYQFMQHRLAGFQGREDIIRAINAEVSSQLETASSRITMVAAQSGIGKSSLMAAIVRYFEETQADTITTIHHFVGCTSQSNYVDSILLRFWKSCLRLLPPALQQEMITETEMVRKGLDGLLKLLAQAETGHRIVFVIDAINQLQPSQAIPVPDLLKWLPMKTPRNVAIVVSTISTHDSCQHAKDEGIIPLSVSALSKHEINLAASAYMERYDKKLTEQLLALISSSSENTGHPLYLRILLDELRVFGVYEKLEYELSILLQSDGVVELYSLVIKRWQTKFNHPDARVVELVMRVLYISRIGLSEQELDEYTSHHLGGNFQLAEWKAFFYTLSDSLFVRNGRHKFFHQLLVNTVKDYLFGTESDMKEARVEYGNWLLGQYADDADASEELVAEICFQLLEADNLDALVEYLKNDYVVIKMLGPKFKYEFFKCWRVLGAKGISHVDVYSRMAKSLTPAGDVLVGYFLEAHENPFLATALLTRISRAKAEDQRRKEFSSLGKVYKNQKRWADAIAAFEKSLVNTDGKGEIDTIWLVSVLDDLGDIYRHQGRYSNAQDYYKRAMEIRTSKLANQPLEIAHSLDNLASIELLLDRPEIAIRLCTQALEIRTMQLGKSHPDVTSSFLQIGRIHRHTKCYEQATTHFESSLSILETTFGRKHPKVAFVLYEMSLLEQDQDRFDLALAHLQESVQINSSCHGENHPDVVDSYFRMADIYFRENKYDDALAAYTKTFEIRRRVLGPQHPDTATALESIGVCNYLLERIDQVPKIFLDAASIRQATKTAISITDPFILHALADVCQEAKLIPVYRGLLLASRQSFCTAVSPHREEVWRITEKIDASYAEADAKAERIRFWQESKTFFTCYCDWADESVWIACTMLANLDRSDSDTIHPIELTQARSVMSSILDRPCEGMEWSPDEYLSNLTDLIDVVRRKPELGKDLGRILSVMNYAGFTFAGISFDGLTIEDADFSLGLLDSASFKGATLRNSRVDQAVLSNASLRSASLERVYTGIPVVRSTMDAELSSVCILKTADKIAFAVGSIDGRISLLEMGRDHTSWSKPIHRAAVTQMIHIPSTGEGCGWIASSSRDMLICITDIDNGSVLRTLRGHTSVVSGLCFVPSRTGNQHIVSCGHDNSVRVWNAETGVEVGNLQGHTGNINSVCLVGGLTVGAKGSAEGTPDCDAQYFASASDDKTVRLWRLGQTSEVLRFSGHTHSVVSLCMVAGVGCDNLLVSAGKDGSVRTWNLLTGKAVRMLSSPCGTVTGLCPVTGSAKEVWIAVSGTDGSIRLWDILTGHLVRMLHGHKNSVSGLQSMPICENQKTIKSVGGQQDESAREASGGTETGVTGAWSIVSVGIDRTVRLWDLSAAPPKRASRLELPGVSALCVVEHPLLQQECPIAVGGVDGSIRLLSIASERLASPEPVAILSGHRGAILSLACLKDGESWSCLASGGSDRSIRIWDIGGISRSIKHVRTRTPREKLHLQGHTGGVSVLLGLDGRRLASGSQDRTVRLWNLVSGVELKRFEGHTRPVTSLTSAVSPTGSLFLISGSADHTIRVWDADSGDTLSILNGHSNNIVSLCVLGSPLPRCGATFQEESRHVQTHRPESDSENSRTTDLAQSSGELESKVLIVSGSGDRTVRIWDFSTGVEISRLQTNPNSVTAMVAHAASNTDVGLIVATSDHHVYLWRVSEGLHKQDRKELCIVSTADGDSAHTGHTAYVTGMTTAANGKLVVSGSEDRSVRVWNFNGGLLMTRYAFGCARLLHAHATDLSQCQNLSWLQRLSFYQAGAISDDASFLDYCARLQMTSTQARSAASITHTMSSSAPASNRSPTPEEPRQLRNSVAGSWNPSHAHVWRIIAQPASRRAESLQGLMELSRGGSREAFVAMQMLARSEAHAIAGEELCMSATLSVSECFEKGWGVDRSVVDAVRACEILASKGRAEGIARLQSLAKHGSDEALQALETLFIPTGSAQMEVEPSMQQQHAQGETRRCCLIS